MEEIMPTNLEELKEKAIYHHDSFMECIDAICEIDEVAGSELLDYLQEKGGC
jgi:hypothetical protein